MTAPAAEDIFLAALDRPTAERDSFLDSACTGDPNLLERVRELLDAHRGAGPLDGAAAADSTVDLPREVDRLGTAIGPYKLVSVIGHGGMGTVYLAQQQEPVRRLVALKVIKAGMDSRQVVARFEAERQALAVMDHPNISKVLDGGATPDGRPYFVMELVKGTTITRYCDEHRLTPRKRLELVLPVCRAVQHAHQKGVIHRDLKPSNVLVAPYDSRPVVKVIDFGVAKATGQPLTESTLVTGLGAVVGTPQYMSPEQAALNNLDVDTRSDVYSLGVLLYELLTGTTPLPKGLVQEAGLLEALRSIREDETPRPSTRLSTVKDLSAVAASRGVEPRRLSGLVKGELDRIVMKALEKDRECRYESAEALARDIERHLAGEPVHACPPTVGYRFRKFARRNRRALVMGTVLAAAVLAAAGSIGWGLRDRAARRAESAAQARESLARARTWVGENKLAQARQELALATGRLGDLRAGEPQLAQEIEALEADLSRFDRFLTLIDRAHEAELTLATEAAPDIAVGAPVARRVSRPLERESARAVPFLLDSMAQYAVLDRNDWSAALDETSLHPNQLRQIRRGVYEELLWLVNDLTSRLCDHRTGQKCTPAEAARQGLVYLQKAESAQGLTPAFYRLRGRCRQALGETEAARLDASVAEQTPAVIGLDHYLPGCAALRLRDKAKAAEHFHAALRIEPGHYWSMMKLGYCLTDLGKEQHEFMTAVTAFSGCILKRPDHALPYVCRSLAFARMRRWDDALADSSKAIELNSGDADVWGQRGLVYTERGDYPRALVDYARALELNPDNAHALNNRGIAHYRRGVPAEAVADASRAIALKPTFAPAWLTRGMAYESLKRHPDAIADCSKAIELDPSLVAAWNIRGIVRMALQEYLRAAADFSEAVKLDPGYAHAWCNRGNAYSKLGQLDEAIDDYGRCIEVQSTYQSAWYNRGCVYLQRGQYPKAIADLSKATELDGRHAEAWCNRGNAHGRRQQYAEALADFSKALEIKPDLIEARYNRGVVYRERREWESAVADLSKVIDVDPTYQSALTFRGTIYLHQLHQYEKADADFSRVLATRPKDATVWFKRGNARHRSRRFDDAVADYTRAIDIRSDYAEAWRNRGIARVMADRLDAAEGDFREALRLQPDSAATRRCLAACLNDLAWSLLNGADPKRRDPARAVERAAEAVRLEAQDGDYRLLLGVAHFRAGNWDAARSALEKAMELRKASGCVHWFYLAMAYHRTGNREKAQHWFDRAAGEMETLKVRDGKVLALAAEAAGLMQTSDWLVSWAEGYGHAEAGRWDKAVAELTRVVEHKPRDAQVWYRLALLRLYTGDADGYRRVCQAMLEQFGRTDEEDAVHHLAWACALTQNALADFGPVLQALEKARIKDPMDPAHLQRHGIALYGAGRLDEAAAKLDEARSAATWAGNIWDWLFLVQIHRRLGHPEQADQWSARADDWMAKNLKRVDWATRLQAEVLRREADRLIRAAKK